VGPGYSLWVLWRVRGSRACRACCWVLWRVRGSQACCWVLWRVQWSQACCTTIQPCATIGTNQTCASIASSSLSLLSLSLPPPLPLRGGVISFFDSNLTIRDSRLSHLGGELGDFILQFIELCLQSVI